MNILLVEDQEDQVLLTEAAFEAAGVEVKLCHVDQGVKCMAYLRKLAPYADAATPDLVLLDLNMPLMDGFEVLEALAQDETLRQVPVVVLTTSSNPADVRRTYALGCNTYVSKPLDFDALAGAMKQLTAYWFDLATLPTGRKPI